MKYFTGYISTFHGLRQLQLCVTVSVVHNDLSIAGTMSQQIIVGNQSLSTPTRIGRHIDQWSRWISKQDWTFHYCIRRYSERVPHLTCVFSVERIACDRFNKGILKIFRYLDIKI